jgi:hypothetical protein
VRLECRLTFVLFVDMDSYKIDGRQMTETEIRDYEHDKMKDQPSAVQEMYEQVGYADENLIETSVQVTFEEVSQSDRESPA